MPAVSEKQRRYLAARFGIEWMRRHHFDNKGKLPVRVSGKNALMEAHRKSKGKR
jgi:hypothetical protein